MAWVGAVAYFFGAKTAGIFLLSEQFLRPGAEEGRLLWNIVIAKLIFISVLY